MSCLWKGGNPMLLSTLIRCCKSLKAESGSIAAILACLFVLQDTARPQIPMEDVQIHASSGIILEATITRPLGLPPSGGFPGVVLIHGFGGSKNDMQTVAITIAMYGYASIAYSVRGQGNSGGLSTVCGELEKQDLLDVIQFFRNSSNINPEKLGVAGGSQGGIHSWMAAVYRMPGVQAVTPLIATPDFARALIPNGCVTNGLVAELSLGSVQYSGDRDRLRNFVVADQYDSVQIYIDERDLAHLIDSVRIPVLQGLGWADVLFPVNGGIHARERLAARGIPAWSYFGTNSHGEIVDPAEAAFLLQKMVQWFDHWLKGFSLDQDTVPMVFYSDDRPGWPHHTTAVWPPEPSGTLRLYITRSGLARLYPAAADSFSFSVTYNDPSFTPGMGWDSLYGGASFLEAFTSSPVRFLSGNVLGADAEITGIPSGQIMVQSDAGEFQAHVRLYDVAPSDTGPVWSLISRSINGIRQSTPDDRHRISFQCRGFSHIIPAGHRIGVEVTSLDMLDDVRANTVPYFLSSHSMLYTMPDDASYIDLPVVGEMPPLLAMRDNDPAAVRAFRLDQNYPNPFNPVTTVSFVISSAGGRPAIVTLKVYDVLGREVAELANGRMATGIHTIRWNASGYPGGVYYYRLMAGEFSQTRKMMLVK